jgi:hypothetical protein
MLTTIINGIRKASDADILILEGTASGDSIYPVYRSLEYNFPRVLMLDVKDCTWVEVDNPLPKPLAIQTFWVPNVILSSDYLITVTPLKIINNKPQLSLMNLLTALPSKKYGGEVGSGWEALYSLGIDRVIADLYFTLPFDLGIIEARYKLVVEDKSDSSRIVEDDKIYMGEPYQIDREAAEILGIPTEYLELIDRSHEEFDI